MNAVDVVVSRVLVECVLTRVGGGDVDVEGSVVFGHLSPDLCCEARVRGALEGQAADCVTGLVCDPSVVFECVAVEVEEHGDGSTWVRAGCGVARDLGSCEQVALNCGAVERRVDLSHVAGLGNEKLAGCLLGLHLVGREAGLSCSKFVLVATEDGCGCVCDIG